MVRTLPGLIVCVLAATPVFAQVQVAPAPTVPQVPAVTRQAPPLGSPEIPSFASLFRDLGTNLRQLPSRENGLLLGTAGAISFAVQGHDAAVTRQVSNSATLDAVFEPGEVVGGALQVGAAFATYAFGRAASNARMAVVGGDLVRAQMLNAVLTQGVKLSVKRTRPDGSRFSFPSGHASSSFATATVLQRHFGWKAGVPAYGLAAFVGGSRLQENRHYLSDVVFGAAVGIVAGRTVTIGRGQTRFAVAPFTTPGGAGVNLTLVERK